VVAIEELPETPETIWLRVLGRGETQKRAVAELQAMPKSTPMRYETLQLVFSWRVTIGSEDLAAEFAIQEEIMALSEAYLAWETELKETSREEGLREGLLEGEEKRAMAIALNLLNQGIAMEVITKATGLTIAQIQQLQDGRTS
jgi:predicted transposase/invertase (TIGR01784 family)